MKNKNEIIKKHLILCEGVDELYFLIAWLNSEELMKKDLFWSEEVQLFDFGGNEELNTYISGLVRADRFDQVQSILIIRDAERDVNKAIDEIKSALKKNELPVPCNVGQWDGDEIKIAYLLLPSLDNEPCSGTLEDLCYDILSESDKPKEVLLLIERFLHNLEELKIRKFSHRHKSKLHTYFSVTDKYVSAKIGEAARWGAFDWGNKRLKYLEALLEQVK